MLRCYCCQTEVKLFNEDILILKHYNALPFVNTNVFSHNIILNTPGSSAYIPAHITNRVRAGGRNYRHVKARNMIEINISTEAGGDKNLNAKKLIFQHLMPGLSTASHY